MDVPDPFAWLRDLGIDVARVLHGAQAFRYFAPVYAGDRLTFASRIEDVFRKKRGALTFLVKDNRRHQPGRASALPKCRSTIIVRGEHANVAKPAAAT